MLYEGDFSSPPGRFALIAARFNDFVVDQLVGGAVDALHRHGIADDRIDLVRVPGSYEIPVIAQKLGKSGKYAAVICLGCVIRGDTDHYDHVAGAAANGIYERLDELRHSGDFWRVDVRHIGAGAQQSWSQGWQQRF